MTNEHELTVRIVTPDEVKEENVLLVLREFFGDLIQTDRFIDATVEAGDYSLNEGERSRLHDMVSSLDEEDLQDLDDFIDSLDE